MTVPFLPSPRLASVSLADERLLNDAQVASLLRYFDDSDKTITDRRSDLCEERVRTERVTTPLGTLLRSTGPFGPQGNGARGTIDLVTTGRAAWFHHPANLYQLTQSREDVVNTPLREAILSITGKNPAGPDPFFNKETVRGYRGQ